MADLKGAGPKISIITVSYNSGFTIRDTLASVAKQTYKNIEYIVIDGGSTDDTLGIVESYSGLVSVIVSEPDKGIYDAMNKGVALATGNIIGILNSDDFYQHENVLSEVADLFERHGSAEALFGDVDFVRDGELDKPIRNYKAGNFIPQMLYLGLMPPHPAIFIRKTAYEKFGIYKTNYKIAADYDLLVRFFLVGKAKYYVVNRRWVRMREGGASTSGLKSNMLSTSEMSRSLRENKLIGFYFLLLLRLPIKLGSQVFPRYFNKIKKQEAAH